MKWRVAPLVALFVSAVASIAPAQSQDVTADPLFKLDGKTRAQVEALIDSARVAGLPQNLIRLKALQGLTMKADGPKIVSTVRQYYAVLLKSKEVLGPVGPAEIDARAGALVAGLRPEELAQFRVTSNGRSPSKALVYLADLIGTKRGIPHDDAVAAFAKLWKDGASDAEFDGLWHGIDQDILSGQSPTAALQSQLRRLPARLNRPPAEQNKENPRS